MLSPNRDNIYKYFFIATAVLVILSYVIWKELTWPEELRGNLLQYGTLPAALLTFVLGLLTMLTRPPHPDDDLRKAQDKAPGLLDKIAQSKDGHLLTNASIDVVQIAKLIESSNISERDLHKSLLDELYQLAPACLLPRNYRENESPILDWHMYDLCIIAHKEDIDLANRIRNNLKDKGLRVYLDVTDYGGIGELQNPFIKKVFHSGSRKCLALLSIHTFRHPRRKEELYQAMQRAQVKDAGCRDYLIPIPIDNEGLDDMREDPFLREYAEKVEIIRDPKKLFDVIIYKLSNLLETTIYPTLPGPVSDNDKPAASKRFAIALSFTGEHRDRVKAIAEELKKRLHGEEIFYDGDYEHELSGRDLDISLQNIYRHQSELIVVFLCAGYENKRWCRVEWSVVREMLHQPQSTAIMIARFDNTHIEELSTNHGYSDCEHRKAGDIADLIIKRLTWNRQFK